MNSAFFFPCSAVSELKQFNTVQGQVFKILKKTLLWKEQDLMNTAK